MKSTNLAEGLSSARCLQPARSGMGQPWLLLVGAPAAPASAGPCKVGTALSREGRNTARSRLWSLFVSLGRSPALPFSTCVFTVTDCVGHRQDERAGGKTRARGAHERVCVPPWGGAWASVALPNLALASGDKFRWHFFICLARKKIPPKRENKQEAIFYRKLDSLSKEKIWERTPVFNNLFYSEAWNFLPERSWLKHARAPRALGPCLWASSARALLTTGIAQYSCVFFRTVLQLSSQQRGGVVRAPSGVLAAAACAGWGPWAAQGGSDCAFAWFPCPSGAADGELVQMAVWHLAVGSIVAVVCCSVHREREMQVQWWAFSSALSYSVNVGRVQSPCVTKCFMCS